jgi:hypothetical protein
LPSSLRRSNVGLSIIGLSRNDGAKDYKTKVLQDFLRKEGIIHEVTEKCCPQSNEMAEILNLTIIDKVRCMLIDANSTPKLWPYASHSALIYIMETHPIFRSSTSSIVFVMLFNRQSFYISWRKDQQNDSFLE